VTVGPGTSSITKMSCSKTEEH